MRLLHILVFLFTSGVALAQPTPDANTRLFGQKGNDLIPVTVGQILGLSTGVTTNATLSGAGTSGSPLGIAQQGAAAGNILGWNGSTWGPASGNVIVPNATILAANTGTTTANGLNFSAAGPSWGSPAIGPYMVMRGNDFSAFAGQRGAVYFVAGQPSGTITGEDGRLFFRSPSNDVSFQSATGSYFYDNSGALNFGIQPTGQIVTRYGQGTFNNIANYYAGFRSDGVLVERTARQMSQEVSNWGNLWGHIEFPNFAAAGQKVGWCYVQGVGTIDDAPTGGTTAQWYSYTVSLGSEFSILNYAMQVAIPRTPANGVSPAQYIRFREAGVWGAWTKQAAGLADNLVQMGATTSHSLRWNGTTWGPTTGFSVSATGEVTSTPLSGSGNRLLAVNSAGTIIAGTTDPANIFYQNNSYSASVGNALRWNGTAWAGQVENGNFGRKALFGSYTTFDLAGAVEGFTYVYNPAGGGTAIPDQPPVGGIHGWYTVTTGIGSDFAITDHAMQVCWGNPVSGNKDEHWKRYKRLITGVPTWTAWERVNTIISGGTTNSIPIFTSATNIGNSLFSIGNEDGLTANQYIVWPGFGDDAPNTASMPTGSMWFYDHAALLAKTQDGVKTVKFFGDDGAVSSTYTDNFTIMPTSQHRMLICNAASNAITLTLNAGVMSFGYDYEVIAQNNTSGGARDVVITCASPLAFRVVGAYNTTSTSVTIPVNRGAVFKRISNDVYITIQ